jgi:hypothetical protein
MTNDPQPQAAPDIHRAIAKALQSAAALVSDEQVIDFFRGMVGRIVAHRWPIDAGNIVNNKCQDEVAGIILALLAES